MELTRNHSTVTVDIRTDCQSQDKQQRKRVVRINWREQMECCSDQETEHKIPNPLPKSYKSASVAPVINTDCLYLNQNTSKLSALHTHLDGRSCSKAGNSQSIKSLQQLWGVCTGMKTSLVKAASTFKTLLKLSWEQWKCFKGPSFTFLHSLKHSTYCCFHPNPRKTGDP